MNTLPQSVKGTVVSGYRRARSTGFPTANLSGDSITASSLQEGTYAGYTCIDGNRKNRYPSVIFFGTPYMEEPGTAKRVEVHLLEQEVDLYGKEIEATFVYFIRENQKFGAPQQLAKAIHNDFLAAIKYFAFQSTR